MAFLFSGVRIDLEKYVRGDRLDSQLLQNLSPIVFVNNVRMEITSCSTQWEAALDARLPRAHTIAFSGKLPPDNITIHQFKIDILNNLISYETKAFCEPPVFMAIRNNDDSFGQTKKFTNIKIKL